MDILIKIGQLILCLSILVILHELGHFLAARAFKIRVEKFYLFFDAWNFSLFKFKYKGVEYGMGWLPLGGYVKISGMIDESMDTDQMAGPPQPWEFRSKPAWQRLIVMLGGIIVNIFLGIFIFWMLIYRYGETYTPSENVKYGVVPGIIGKKIGLKTGDKITEINGKPFARFEELISPKVLLDNPTFTVQRNNEVLHVKVPVSILNDLSDYGAGEFITLRNKFAVDAVSPKGGAQKAGLRKGDSITAINGKPVVFFDQLQAELKQSKNKDVALTIKRNNQPLTLNAHVDTAGILGFLQKPELPKDRTINYGLFESLPIGATKAWSVFTSNAKGVAKIFTGEVKARKAISSPIGITTMFSPHLDWYVFWSMAGLLSMVLAFTNLLPIPALDGGHSLFLIIEMVKGKPLSDKFLERAQIVGFVLLISLMVFAFGNDIVKQITKH